MNDMCCEYSLALSGGTLKLNESMQDTLMVLPPGITGLDGRPIRSTIIPRGATDGGKKLTARFGPRLIRVPAFVFIAADPGVSDKMINPKKNMTTYLTRVNTLVNLWETRLEGNLNTSFAMTYTPTGMSGQSETVTYGDGDGEFQSLWEIESDVPILNVSFTLVAETG